MPPFDSLQSAILGFVFGSIITWLIAGEIWARRTRSLIDKMADLLEEVHHD